MKRRILPLSPLARKSVADVTRRKGRTVLVVLGILIGVLGLTAINVAAGALGAAFQYSADETARSNIAIDVDGVDPSLAPVLSAVPNVKQVQIWSFYQARWQISAAPGHVNMGIYASDDLGNLKINPFQLSSGSLPGPGEIVLEESDRGLQSFKVGDTITIETPNGPASLRVSGISRTLGTGSATFDDYGRGYITFAELRQLTGATRPNLVDVLENDTNRGQQTAVALTNVLKAHGSQVQSANVRGNDFSSGAIGGVFTIMRVLSLIALLLTSFLIINTVTTLVAEQTKIIGTMKAVGATRWMVMRGYLSTVLVYGVIGTALGIVAGIYAGYAFVSFLASIIILDLGPFSVDAGILAVSVAVGLGIPFAAALLPLWNGTRITVRDAMTGYGVSGGGKTRTRKTRAAGWALFQAIPQTTWLGLRGLFRRRGRAVLTLLALTLSATAFLSIQTTTYSVNAYQGQIFTQYGFDAFVGIDHPLPYDKIKTQLLSVPNVASVERFEQDGVGTKWGELVLEGFEPNAALYHYQVTKGRWFAGDEPNAIILSEQAATRSELTVGDTITVSNSLRSVTWHIVGIAHDLNGSLGTIGVGLTTIANLHGFNGEPLDVGSDFMVQGRDHSSAAVNAMANRVDDMLAREGLNPSISTRDQQIARNQGQFQILYILLYAVAAIVALVGLLGLFNTLTTSVLERRREIGILRSMGATSWRVASVFWAEGMALAGISWGVGVALGIPAAYGFVLLLSAVLLPLPFAFSPMALVAMLIFTLLLASLASILPALSAARVRVAETLRYE